MFPIVTGDLAKTAHMLVLKYLAEFGWASTVVTVDENPARSRREVWHGVEVLRVAPRDLRWRLLQPAYRARKREDVPAWRRKLSRVSNLLLQPLTTALSFPDRFGAVRRELSALLMELQGEQPGFDAILSLYSPITAHLLAQQFSRRTGVPWIALTKDFYSWPDALLDSRAQRLANAVKRRYEPRCLRGARALVSISDYMTSYYRMMFPGLRLETLAHCYDEAEFAAVDPVFPGDGTFRLVTVGLASRHDQQELAVMLDGIAEMLADGRLDPNRFRFRHVGGGHQLIQDAARRSGCQGILELVAPVPHAEAVRELKSATCLCFKQHPWGTRRRLTEYLASRRPILAFPEYPGELSNELLSQYGAARIAADKQAFQRELGELFSVFQREGRLALNVNEEVVQAQSARRRAEQLAAILDDVLAKN